MFPVIPINQSKEANYCCYALIEFNAAVQFTQDWAMNGLYLLYLLADTVEYSIFYLSGWERDWLFLYPATESWVISVTTLPRQPTLLCSQSFSMVKMHGRGHDTKTNCITSSRPTDDKNTHLR